MPKLCQRKFDFTENEHYRQKLTLSVTVLTQDDAYFMIGVTGESALKQFDLFILVLK